MTASPAWADVTADVAIAGAGCSGLGMAIKLDNAGHQDFVVLETAAEVGGT
jgi:cation diffusion facilitator CzcD-associated flavoprotein CzcO